jgi:5-methylcytosine-specific restriction protein A
MPYRASTFQPQSPRKTALERGYNYRWQKASKRFLREHPLCVACAAEGRDESATLVDHVKPHRGDYELFWNEKNWQSLCERHHNLKTARGE